MPIKKAFFLLCRELDIVLFILVSFYKTKNEMKMKIKNENKNNPSMFVKNKKKCSIEEGTKQKRMFYKLKL